MGVWSTVLGHRAHSCRHQRRDKRARREIYLSGRQSDRNRLESASGLQAGRFRRSAEMRFADEHDMGSQVAITLLVPSVWRSICCAHIVSWRVQWGPTTVEAAVYTFTFFFRLDLGRLAADVDSLNAKVEEKWQMSSRENCARPLGADLFDCRSRRGANRIYT